METGRHSVWWTSIILGATVVLFTSKDAFLFPSKAALQGSGEKERERMPNRTMLHHGRTACMRRL